VPRLAFVAGLVILASLSPGGGDTELAVDTGGNLYFNDLTLANFSTARSEDHGAAFVCSNTGVPDAAVDRQWYAVDGNPRTGDGTGTGAGHNIYLANDEIGPDKDFTEIIKVLERRAGVEVKGRSRG